MAAEDGVLCMHSLHAEYNQRMRNVISVESRRPFRLIAGEGRMGEPEDGTWADFGSGRGGRGRRTIPTNTEGQGPFRRRWRSTYGARSWLRGPWAWPGAGQGRPQVGRVLTRAELQLRLRQSASSRGCKARSPQTNDQAGFYGALEARLQVPGHGRRRQPRTRRSRRRRGRVRPPRWAVASML